MSLKRNISRLFRFLTGIATIVACFIAYISLKQPSLPAPQTTASNTSTNTGTEAKPTQSPPTSSSALQSNPQETNEHLVENHNRRSNTKKTTSDQPPSLEPDGKASWSIRENVAIDTTASIIKQARKIAYELNNYASDYSAYRSREADFEMPLKETALHKILSGLTFIEKHQRTIRSVASNDSELTDAINMIHMKPYYENELARLKK